MSISTAMRLLDVDSPKKLNYSYIRRIYKRKMKIHHPDLKKSDEEFSESHKLGEAFLILKSEIENIKNEKEAEHLFNMNRDITNSVIVDLSDIINVYKGKEVFDSNGNRITKEKLKNENTIINVELAVEFSGQQYTQKYEVKKEFSDRYTLYYNVICDIGEELSVKILDKEINISIQYNRVILQYNFDYIVNITLIIDRKDRL